MSTAVVDVGTSSIRALVFDRDFQTIGEHHAPLPPTSPAPGLVEFDAAAMAATAVDLLRRAIDQAGPVDGVGIATQRSSAVVWDRATGRAIDAGLGWQDLRTAGACLAHQSNGLRFAPNQAATKFEHLLDRHDPERQRDLCCGTVDSWMVWALTEGAHHVTDTSNASVTGLWSPESDTWSVSVLEGLRLAPESLPTLVDSMGPIGPATALPGAPPIVAILGDQQASMLGQGAIAAGQAKCTFGTGAMLDICGGDEAPTTFDRTPNGTFPLVAWTRAGQPTTWANEAIMLAAGAAIEWLRDGLGIFATVEQVSELAATVADADGVVFVPDLAGAGTPQWDFGAAGALFGLTRGSGRAEIARAVLDGIAHRGADLLEAAEADLDLVAPTLRVDGGLSQSAPFIQALANATQRPIELSAHVEATALGAGYAARLALEADVSVADLAAANPPREVVEPTAPTDRDRWRMSVERAGRWNEAQARISF